MYETYKSKKKYIMCNKAKMREAREDFFDVMAEDAGKCEMRGTNSKHHIACVLSP